MQNAPAQGARGVQRKRTEAINTATESIPPYLVLLRGPPDNPGLSTTLISERNNQRSLVEHDLG